MLELLDSFSGLRSVFYEIEHSRRAENVQENIADENYANQKATSAPLESSYALFRTTISQATAYMLDRHYSLYLPITDRRKVIKTEDRDREIRARYAAGANIKQLAEIYGLTDKRIYQIVRA